LIERERDCVPVPHDLVHGVQALKARTVQWIGHGPWLQACVSDFSLQARPPLIGCVVGLTRFLKPAPHDVEHGRVLQSGNSPYLQSIGQLCSLQLRASCG
jgi:hypothetical protein